MDKDHWPSLHADPFARERLRKSCELLRCAGHHSVLDVGCHRKEALEFLPKHITYTGLDSLLGDDFDGGTNLVHRFDRILCLEVLEHLKFPDKTLKHLSARLTDHGVFVLSLPNEASIFHRLRSILGTVDQECFSEDGKHLHLPSLKQARAFVSRYLKIESEEYYISDGCGSRQSFLRPILKLIPLSIIRCLASFCPSLFARGFIFQCVKSP